MNFRSGSTGNIPESLAFGGSRMRRSSMPSMPSPRQSFSSSGGDKVLTGSPVRWVRLPVWPFGLVTFRHLFCIPTRVMLWRPILR